MRTCCPKCSHRYDVPIRAVLAEAERLKRARPLADAPRGPDADGNTLAPDDAQARRLRSEAVARRTGKSCG